MGRANHITLAAYRRKVAHVLVQRGVSKATIAKLLKNWRHLVVARWNEGKKPENAAAHVLKYEHERLHFGRDTHPRNARFARDASITPHLRDARFARDASNPQPGEVYESRAGNRWLVTGKTPKGRIVVKRGSPKFGGELQWTPTMLARLKQVRGEEAKAVAAAIPPGLQQARFPSGVSLVDRILGRKPQPGEQLTLFRDPNRRYHVYVIETMNHGKRQFYVGQTGKKPEQRFEEHQKGGHYSYAHGAKLLRKDLTRKVPPLYTRQQAERVEKLIARTLRKRGLKVIGGH
jgi:predicted GIY-YIG superfamily endonuclease